MINDIFTISVSCAECGKSLNVIFDDEEVAVTPCEYCMERAFNAGKEEGGAE